VSLYPDTVPFNRLLILCQPEIFWKERSHISCVKFILSRSSLKLSHPESADLAFLYGTILTDGKEAWSEEETTNLCVFADRQVDRSPCGSGVTARVAVQYHKGLLPPGGWGQVEQGKGLYIGRCRIPFPFRESVSQTNQLSKHQNPIVARANLNNFDHTPSLVTLFSYLNISLIRTSLRVQITATHTR